MKYCLICFSSLISRCRDSGFIFLEDGGNQDCFGGVEIVGSTMPGAAWSGITNGFKATRQVYKDDGVVHTITCSITTNKMNQPLYRCAADGGKMYSCTKSTTVAKEVMRGIGSELNNNMTDSG